MKVFSTSKAYGDAVGPLGFPMHSDYAREAEGLMKGQSAELRDLFSTQIGGERVAGYLRAAKAAEFLEADEDSRTDISLVTTGSVDRDFEVVLPGGGDWSQWRKNPIVTFAHIYDALPVGRGLWVKRQKNDNPIKDGWLAKTQYSTKPPDWPSGWFPDAVFHMTLEKILRGKSVGFIPLEVKPPQEKDIQRRPELAGVRYLITKWIVLEYAVAPVQANPDALIQSISKSLDAVPDAVLAELGLVFPLEAGELNDYFDEVSDDDVFAAEVRGNVTKYCNRIHEVTFPKTSWTEKTAEEWLARRGFRNAKATERAGTELRFRQFVPSDCLATSRSVALDGEVSVHLSDQTSVPETTPSLPSLKGAVTASVWLQRRKRSMRRVVKGLDVKTEVQNAVDAALGRL